MTFIRLRPTNKYYILSLYTRFSVDFGKRKTNPSQTNVYFFLRIDIPIFPLKWSEIYKLNFNLAACIEMRPIFSRSGVAAETSITICMQCVHAVMHVQLHSIFSCTLQSMNIFDIVIINIWEVDPRHQHVEIFHFICILQKGTGKMFCPLYNRAIWKVGSLVLVEGNLILDKIFKKD